MSELVGALLILACIAQAVITMAFGFAAWMDHGIYEKNLIRTFAKSLRGFIWPLLLIKRIKKKLAGIYKDT